jgi:c-di-GMP-binding flagellar brake protein YcgR
MDECLRGHEKRRHIRVPLAFDPRFTASRPAEAEIDLEGVLERARLMDVSEGGAGLLCGREYARGVKVTIVFAVGLKEGAREVLIRASGVVRFCAACSEAQGFRVGVEFARIDRASQECLRQYVCDLLRPQEGV